MQWLLLILGIFFVVVLFETAPKIGALLIAILLLGYLVTAQNKGLVQ